MGDYGRYQFDARLSVSRDIASPLCGADARRIGDRKADIALSARTCDEVALRER